MRSAIVAVLFLTTLAGCAADRSKPVEATQPLVFRRPAPAAALAFDAPTGLVLSYQALARDYRDPAAYVGYDDIVTTYSYTLTDDRQYLFDNFNDFERRVISARTSVSYR